MVGYCIKEDRGIKVVRPRIFLYTRLAFFAILFFDGGSGTGSAALSKKRRTAGRKGCPFVDTLVRFDAWDLSCKAPFGAVSTGTEIMLRVSVAKTLHPLRVYVILRKDGMNNMTVTEDQFYSNVTDPGSQRRILFSQVSSSFQMKTYEVRFTVEEEELYFYGT